ncbi:hypothetical protein [Flexivirga oryzae]|uniref:Heme/copper-type cytochrome/quinol oxidase subunit 4 n=1 Tax=Flexivirga oryzae TaxID=1794944 RepID=A0A839MZU9_9MICO|nr:hypothetical protein [Flexivirga oryzae]MBB2890990.1 heme/copper-type cytochrome/quinol oxidase subunit 4 [Flexivirga oryzae]
MSESAHLPSGIRSAVPFTVIAAVGIVLGGAVSAASAPNANYTASWAVAYLVLVVGIAQLALGVAQALLAPEPPSSRTIAAQVLTYNLANVAVLVGTLVGRTVIVDLGGVLMLVSLVLFMWASRGARTTNTWLLYGFRVVVAILVVTTPIGLIISAVRGQA